MKPERYITRCLLGAHGLLLCMCLFGMANAQPTANPTNRARGLEEMLQEMNSGSISSVSAFRMFVQRAQLVITGLIHVSILVLPRLARTDVHTAHNSSSATATSDKSKHKDCTSFGCSNAKATTASGSIGTAPKTETTTFVPADGSDFAAWKKAQSELEKHTSYGINWSNSCIYVLSTEQGPMLTPAPSYPVTGTAAFAAGITKKEAIICNDYDLKGPHYADWEGLRSTIGARSMASIPLYASGDKEKRSLVGVLTLATSELHAFDGAQALYKLAAALAPYASMLRYASYALRVNSFVAHIMPPLLRQNYMKTTGARGKHAVDDANPAELNPNAKICITKSANKNQLAVRNEESWSRKPLVQQTREKSGRPLANSGTAVLLHPTITPLVERDDVIGGNQFAENAEVLVTAGNGRVPQRFNTEMEGGVCPESNGLDPEPQTKQRSPVAQSAVAPMTTTRQGKKEGSGINRRPPKKGHRQPRLPAPGHNNTRAPSTTESTDGNRLAEKESSSHQVDGDQLPVEVDLDWGDFLFNLVSMCIVYAYFSEAAVAGESRAAVAVSIGIALVDVALLGLRWLWYERHISYGGGSSVVFRVFHMYRLIVLPIANTWMGWSLMNKLGVRPGLATVGVLGVGFVMLLALGLRTVQSRWLLQAPLQLASVALSAGSAPQMCSRVFAGQVLGLKCMGAVSVLQLGTGFVLPAILSHAVDLRMTTGKHYLPHLQAKIGLFQ